MVNNLNNPISYDRSGDCIKEPPRNTRVFADVDVAVVGGGMAGVGAAISAARAGAKTLLIEAFGCLGGTGTSGMVNCFCGFTTYGDSEKKQIVQGIGGEIHRNLYDLNGVADMKSFVFNPEILKLILDRMAEEAGVQVLYYTHVTDTILEENSIKGLIIENKAGRQAVIAKRVIDCTGDGDVCALSGVPFELGDGSGNFLSCDMVFHMVNVGNFSADVLNETIKRKFGSGEYELTRPQIITREICIPGAYWVNWAGIPWPANCVDPLHLTKAAIDGRRIVRELRRFLRAEVPGFENMDVIDTAPMIGIRESRRVFGDYILKKEDISSCTKFDDGIGACAWPFEIVDPVKGRIFEWLPAGEYYTIPYRVLLPRGVENLLMAGRFVSCTHEAQSSTRVMGPAVVMGQAAGTAAAISLDRNVSPRKVDTGELRAALVSANAFIGE
ncbi:MAG: FAD-dependent oxidoreductase [Oscillospiraceae bacterium]|jgi:hypothetical protein